MSKIRGKGKKTGNISMLATTSNRFLDRIDPLHAKFPLFDHPFVRHIWESKYRWQDEQTPYDTFKRVAYAIHPMESANPEVAYEAMCAGLWMPGGRIIAGAGTTKRVTLLNCYVNQTLEDSLESIMEGVSVAARTQQQGGGIGTDFSTLRPEGAILHRTGGRASGPLPFMDMWHSMCSTIMSAGDRRGAMMGTIVDTHPDLPKFITAKQQQGRLTNFNLSILVSDMFMEAVKEDADWQLYFSIPPIEDTGLGSFEGDDGQTQYIYSEIKARKLWEQITRTTFEYSEPGVIFIDRVNDLNNLKYTETISCTNPCGEQPLPPHGCCNLGAVNLSRLVHKPFTDSARIDFDLLKEITKLGVRFLDSVIEVTNYPLEAQQEEEFNKRRIGLGVSGLADCLAQLQIRYGSSKAVEITDKIFYTLSQAAYSESIDLAEEKGPFPLWTTELLDHNSWAAQRLDHALLARARKHGLRNGVLLTVAPTGTTSILFGNVSSGIEPVFDHQPKRRVRQLGQDKWETHDTLGYGAALYERYRQQQLEPGDHGNIGDFGLPGYMVTTDDLTIEDHITMQATVQRWVDASVSKTINVSKETTYEQFARVYDLAYSLGCKGCTTYRPSDIRGSILIKAEKPGPLDPKTSAIITAAGEGLRQRPESLHGVTHKIKWPSMSAALYLTINYTEEGIPFEVFLASKDGRHHDWMTATSLMISALLRKGGDIGFIAEELEQVHSFGDTAFIQGPRDSKARFYGSLPAFIGGVLGKYLLEGLVHQAVHSVAPTTKTHPAMRPHGEQCPVCRAPGLEHKEGCKTCNSCGFTSCG